VTLMLLWSPAHQDAPMRGYPDWVNRCAISPSGDSIVSASDDQML